GTRQRHIIFPADQSAEASVRCIKDRQRAAVSLAPNQAFGPRRFEFAVLAEQFAIGSEKQGGAIQSTLAAGCVFFDDTDDDVGLRLLRRLADCFCFRAWYGNGIIP